MSSKILKEAVEDVQGIIDSAVEEAQEKVSLKLGSDIMKLVEDSLEEEDEDEITEDDEEMETEEEDIVDEQEDDEEDEEDLDIDIEDDEEIGDEEDLDIDLDDEDEDEEEFEEQDEFDDDEDDFEDEDEEDVIEVIDDEEDEFDDEDEEEDEGNEIRKLRKDNKNYKRAIVALHKQLGESKLLVHKLVYANKLLTKPGLTKDQKMNIAESLDNASSIKQAKRAYRTLKESFETTLKAGKPRKPSKDYLRILSEVYKVNTRTGGDLEARNARLKKIAGIS